MSFELFKNETVVKYHDIKIYTGYIYGFKCIININKINIKNSVTTIQLFINQMVIINEFLKNLYKHPDVLIFAPANSSFVLRCQ